MSVIWDDLKSRKAEKSNIAAIWLDIAKAYRSVSSQLVLFAHGQYGILEHWISFFY